MSTSSETPEGPETFRSAGLMLAIRLIHTINAEGKPDIDAEYEEPKGTFTDIRLLLSAEELEDHGTLYLTTKRIFWISNKDMKHSLELDYDRVYLHAVSSATEDQPPFVLVHFESPENTYADMIQEQGDGVESNDAQLEPVIKIIPHNMDEVNDIYKIITECLALNVAAESEEHGEMFYDKEKALKDRNYMGNGSEGDMEELIGDDPERFEDAE